MADWVELRQFRNSGPVLTFKAVPRRRQNNGSQNFLHRFRETCPVIWSCAIFLTFTTTSGVGKAGDSPRHADWRRKMGRPRRQLRATEQETCSPPTALENGHFIAQVIKAEGNNLYTVTVPSEKKPLLVELPARFRSTIWIKRGGYVVIDRSAFEGRNNKLAGEIANIVRDEKQWRKEPYW